MQPPYADIALVGAFWNCADRAERLLTAMRPWFSRISIAVQESPDDTLDRVRAIADVTTPDRWHGHGNISFQKAINHAETEWCFLISDDEWPSEDLLESFPELLQQAEEEDLDGFWFHFRSTIEGFDFTREQDNHLRLFRTRYGWPSTIHSRPMIAMHRTAFWPKEWGHIRHDRTLDEMMLDYIRRYNIGRGNRQWEAHNVRMMHSACIAIGRLKGVDLVKSFPWWPEVEALAFTDSSLEHDVEALIAKLGPA